MNSCRCGTKIRPSDPPVRNAKYMHHQKPPPAPVKRVSLAPLTYGTGDHPNGAEFIGDRTGIGFEIESVALIESMKLRDRIREEMRVAALTPAQPATV